METFRWLAPMVLWPEAERIIPVVMSRPQGGGTPRADGRATFAAILFVLTTGCPWREIPKSFDVSWQTAHRRFMQWAEAGVWTSLGRLAPDATVDSEVRAWAAEVTEAVAARLPHDVPDGRTAAGTAPTATRPRPQILSEVGGQFVEGLFGIRKKRFRTADPDGAIT